MPVTHLNSPEFDLIELWGAKSAYRVFYLHFLIVGYCPRYLQSEVFQMLGQDPSSVDLRVERVNLPSTPFQFRLLCRITAVCKDNYRPLIEDM